MAWRSPVVADVAARRSQSLRLVGTWLIATRAELSGPVEHPQANTWQAVGGLLRNAFWQALVPGVDRQGQRP